MRQILCNSNGALVARMPRAAVEPGHVLVKVQYSLISVGTEVASLRPQSQSVPAGAVEKAKVYSGVAKYYLGAALANPAKAARKAVRITKQAVTDLFPEKKADIPAIRLGDLDWTKCSAKALKLENGQAELETDDSSADYQMMSRPIDVVSGCIPVVRVKGKVARGLVSIGLLNGDRNAWLGSRSYDEGIFEDQLIFDPKGSATVTVVVANAGLGTNSTLMLEDVSVQMVPADVNALPLSELEEQGWNVGYSAAGVVIAVGQGVVDFAPGDIVACGGAGKANHADYVSIPRNMVCRVPQGCSVRDAATTTVGIIALQGVRRAQPQLGEVVCVIGLGLIGQMTVQMLRVNGCKVVGFDLSPQRVERAKKLGMDHGTSAEPEFRQMVRDVTGGRGVDRTLITAATKSDAVINLSMQVTRAKGVVVIVGDVGLNVERAAFYRKEIDLLMSTSYGPGRYDKTYEEEGRDYPFAYVRWTMNRNMEAYLDMLASSKLDIASLIDRVIPIMDAPTVYAELAAGGDQAPLGVLINYPDDARELPEPADSASVVIRGHRKPSSSVINYALVGAGAFGTCMLVPQMAKRKDRFFLRAVVSRNAVQGGNFVRANQVEVFASEIEPVLQDEKTDLIVISTRHHEHATQVLKALKAGKHVFVEKPLALNWQELEEIDTTYRSLEQPPMLMVGFNRRFSPAMQALKTQLEHRRSPLIINYRLNGGYIPLDSWIQGAQGGGRNIGEACHMYDAFRFLAGMPVKSIQAAAIDPGTLPYLRNDNFVATITYQDGTVANLVYTALGPKQGLPKERIEVFCDGEAYVLDDFKSLVRAGDDKELWASEIVDKGHFEELSRFGDAIAGGSPAPIPFEELIETTAVSLHVEDILFGHFTEE